MLMQVVYLALAVAIVYLIKACGTGSSQLPLPPGPSGSFFYGVKAQLQGIVAWRQYAQWSQRWNSSVISFRVYNRQVVVLNDHISIHELLNRRANIYSDRPKAWMYHEICARGQSVFNISSLDDRHRQYRRLLANGLGPKATESYWPALQEAAEILVKGLRESPDDLKEQVRRNAATTVMKVAYGYAVTENDQFVRVAEESTIISGQAMAQGRWLVDYYPILRFIPAWLPFAHFKRQGEEWKLKLDYLSGVPHEWVKKQMATGWYIESFTSQLFEAQPTIDEDIIKWCAGGLYAGAADTTVSALVSFILLMAVYPEFQRQAQADADAVLGECSSPRCSDLSKMVYVTALFKEVLRYAPVANLALPHRVTEDDEYSGYRIPKDATVIANVWAVMRDPALYPEPDNFNPSRFLSPSKEGNPDPRAFAFGFGRRTCPGTQFAETSILLNMVSILTNFDVSSSMHQPPPKLEFTPGITSHIKPFPIRITPRYVGG